MILFIDLRGQTPIQRFAFYEEGKFLTFNNYNSWSTWDDFASDYNKSGGKRLAKFREIAPDWVYNDPQNIKERKLPIKVLQYTNDTVNVAELLDVINDVSHNNGLHHGHMQLRLVNDFVELDKADNIEKDED